MEDLTLDPEDDGSPEPEEVASEDSTSDKRKFILFGVVALLVGLGVGALLMLLLRNGETNNSAVESGATSTVSSTASSTVPTSDSQVLQSTIVPESSIEPTPTNRPNAPRATSPPATSPPATSPPVTSPPVTSPPKPVITSFSIPKTVSCAGEQVPYISLSWTTSNASVVSLAIDGPGLYKNYQGGSGSDSVPFSCVGPHTYLLTATGPAGSSSKSVTVTGV
ncbi:MAG: hypothetical protein WCJ04_06715 [Actinomycetes bacterium]